MITQLVKVVNEEGNNWDDYIQPIAFAYHINVQSSTKFSPFELMYGVKPRLPCDLSPDSLSQCEGSQLPTEEQQMDRVMKFTESLQVIREKAQANIKEAQGKQKDKYDIKHSAPTYKVCTVKIFVS